MIYGALAGAAMYTAYWEAEQRKKAFDKLRDEVLNAPPITHPSKNRTTRESGKRKDPRW